MSKTHMADSSAPPVREELARHLFRARAAHPDIALTDEDFLTHLAAKLEAVGPEQNERNAVRAEDLFLREIQLRAAFGVGDDETVDADLDLDDVLVTVLLAIVELALLDHARSVGDIWVVRSDTSAEQL